VVRAIEISIIKVEYSREEAKDWIENALGLATRKLLIFRTLCHGKIGQSNTINE
jgi:hypothetical protein